jgi:hypothetical protein
VHSAARPGGKTMILGAVLKDRREATISKLEVVR